MCNRFTIDSNPIELAQTLDAIYEQGVFDFAAEITPRALTPGLTLRPDGRRVLHPMQFALAPLGSKVPFDPKRLLNNARIESFDKWPWQVPFRRFRCVVPLTSFREPCYWGEPAGEEVSFYPTEKSLLGVASIYTVWKDLNGSESRFTMSLLMRPACEYVMEHGHHRQPFFIDDAGWNAWMEPREQKPKELIELLHQHADEPALAYRVDREMAAAWKSRQKGNLVKRDEQLAEIDQMGHRFGI